MLEQGNASRLLPPILSCPSRTRSHLGAGLAYRNIVKQNSFNQEGRFQLLSHPQTAKTRHIICIKLIYLVKGGVN